MAAMARIRTAQRQSHTVVIVSGRLRAQDMRRLEHACSPALTTARMQLTVDLTDVTEIDQAAEALLRRMANRGAQIRACGHSLAPGTS
jgi:anti-anti-sigma regulatory factor